jgi:hypothetical protein
MKPTNQTITMSGKRKMKQDRHYVVAMIREGKFFSVRPIYTGKTYDRVSALKKAEELNITCEFELKHLDYDRFIAYSLYSE